MEIKLKEGVPKNGKTFLKIIMKTFLLLLCTSVFSFTPSNILSQNAEIKIEKDMTISVDEAFKLIIDQTDYKFIYHEELFENLPKVTLKKGTIRANKLIDKCLESQNFTFVLKNNSTILVSQKSIQSSISGKIVDVNGVPLIGVTVIIKGKNRGAVTDFNGDYTISVNEGETLVFSYIGFKTVEVVVSSNSVINVTLEEDLLQLDEVVINTGYQTTKKSKTTGNVAVISQEQIENRITTDVISRLEGISSGLLLNNDNEDEPTIIVGGQTTFASDISPLIVVDGFPIRGGINSINPDNIASISVLKDAASSAIWGTKSSNGVIVITTKSGSKSTESISISYSSDIIMADRPNFNYLNQASASDIVDFQLDILNAGLTNHNVEVEPGRLTTWQDPVTEAYIGLNGSTLIGGGAGRERTLTQGQFDARINELRQVDRLKEIKEHLYRSTITQRHNFSLSGTTEKNQFFFSALYEDDPSQQVGNDEKRYLFNLKDYFNITDKLGFELGANISFTNENENNFNRDHIVFGTDNRYYHGATVSMFDQDGNLIPTRGAAYQADVYRLQSLGYIRGTSNPIEQIAENDISARRQNIRIRAKLDYDLTPWLNVSAAYSYERIHRYYRIHTSPNNYETRYFRFVYSTIGDNGAVNENFYQGGSLYESNRYVTNKIARGQLNINKSFNEVHNITAVIGMETQSYDRERSVGNYYDYNDSALNFNPTFDFVGLRDEGLPAYYGENLTQAFSSFSKSLRQQRDASYYTNAVYSFDQRYLLSASARIDHANLFGVAKRFQYTPLWSTGLAWNLHNESFFNVDWVSLLKPRVSVGYSARADRNTTGDLVLGTNIRSILYGNRNYITISTRPNPFLTWEKTFNTNVGLDFGLFKNRLVGSIDYYYKNSTELLVNQITDRTYGFTGTKINNGAIINKGLDIDITGKIIDSKNFGWKAQLLYSHNKNTISSVNASDNSILTLLGGAFINGFATDAMFSFKYAGLSTTGEPLVYVDPNDPNSAIVGVDDGAFQLTRSSAVYNGRTTPKHFGGFVNTLTYKNFNLTTSMSYKLGYVFRRPTYGFLAAQRGVTSNDLGDRWRNPGDEAFTNVPGLPSDLSSAYDTSILYNLSDITIEKADHVRLNTISLSYDFPSDFLDNTLFSSLSFTAQVNNLGVIWKATDTNYDPQFAASNVYRGSVTNVDSQIFPSRLAPGREIIIGIRAKF